MASIEKNITTAQALCQQRGVRLTAQREQVLSLLLQEKSAISAYDLLDKLKEIEPNAKPPTVYRALDFLLSQGFVHKVESTNSYICCCSIGHDQHCSQLLICDSCGYVQECHYDQLAQMLNHQAQQTGFKIYHHVIETHGLCQSCQSISS
ncbi:zinc uptake transcriptional repressor Zur [Vibrio sp. SS-MA-C1-2]|uniref:zinc uptake transcriptional repressor Zur n=1 Tax=Vibrio sp. SS-MA-C1-2 TaxID=2908646 RepID=UPI001F4293CD|nr:zinc uptake transcriptional repressor Zur [Vibrio sp. SS-MA-C1-2]UJF19550.1 zinc uptake transcriptional repressor Zur [Vibrio sp. SS-MA-C1-2]